MCWYVMVYVGMYVCNCVLLCNCVCNDQLHILHVITTPLPLGMMCQLKDDAYRLLGSLQQSLLTVVNSVGNIEHSVYPYAPSLLHCCC